MSNIFRIYQAERLSEAQAVLEERGLPWLALLMGLVFVVNTAAVTMTLLAV